MGDRWTAQVFGLTVRGDFPAPGLDHGRAARSRRAATVTLADACALDRVWRDGEGETVCRRTTATGELVMRIERRDGDYRIAAPGHGIFVVSGNGREIAAAPAHPEPWRWQRYLIGQALPLAALLQGVEVLHASAVAIGGRAVAFTGAPSAGKSTLATALVRGGATLLCDDVLAVEAGAGGVLAHPGPAVVNLRHGAERLLHPCDDVATEVGRDDEAVRIRLAGAGAATPLAALYVLDRGGAGDRPAFEQPAAGREASLLLASSFNFIVLDGERLRRQLDVCARLAATAEVAVLRVPAGAGPAAVARAVLERVRGGIRCAA